MLKEDYAGMVSALTQNMEYQYQHIYLHATHSKLCALFHKLEEAEEYLLHQVGGLIRDLGGDPQYEGMMSGQWTATYLKYYKMPMEMLRHDMESERAAIAQALHPTLFISIHHNAEPDEHRATPGAETYYQVASADSKRAAGLVYEELYRGFSAYPIDWVADRDAGAKYRPRSGGGDY
jgi:hypothetical protein